MTSPIFEPFITVLGFGLYILIPVLLITGIILLCRFGRRIFREHQRTRLEIGKIAEEISLVRKNQEASSNSGKSAE